MFKKLGTIILGSSLFFVGIAAPSVSQASERENNTVSTQLQPYRYEVTVKCPVANLRNETTGDYIYGKGKTKAEAVKNANDQVNAKFGTGFKLKHCHRTGS